MLSSLIWRRKWEPTPVFLPGKSHRWMTLIDYSPWGHEELDMTEQLHFHISLSCIGEGNSNPLQRSCLENPGDGGAWWAAIWVTQSKTQLKWLGSSSSRIISIIPSILCLLILLSGIATLDLLWHLTVLQAPYPAYIWIILLRIDLFLHSVTLMYLQG